MGRTSKECPRDGNKILPPCAALASVRGSEMPEPVRILYVHNSADIYGASRSLLRLLPRLDRARFTPIVLLPEDGPLRARIADLGVEVLLHPGLSVITRPVFRSWRIVLFLLNFPLSVLFIARLIRRREVAVVHTNSGVIVSPGLAAKIAGARHLWHIRDWFQEFRGFWPYFARYIVWSSEKIIAVSRAIAGQFADQGKITVIKNGFAMEEFDVDKPRLRSDFRAKLGLGDAFVVGCVGRIKFVRKGQEILVQAAASLEAQGIPAKILIVGTAFPGNELHLVRLRALVTELKLDHCVVWAGEMSDPRPAYAAMDVLVLPSAQPEPFGGVVMEGMAMGVPVIATNIGGSTEQVAEGITGFLVPPSNPAALVEKIAILFRDPALRARMSAAGPVRIAESFSIDDMVRKFERLYLHP